MSAKDDVIGWGYHAGWRAVRALPEPLAVRAFRAAADLAVRRRGPGVIQYARNMVRVLGDRATPPALATVVQDGMRSYARYWMETFRLPTMDLDDVVERSVADSTGLEHIAAATSAGRGVVVALPHSGNWDVAGLMICREFGGLTTVAERLKPESLYTTFVEYRESLGMEVHPADRRCRPRLPAAEGPAQAGQGGLPARRP